MSEDDTTVSSDDMNDTIGAAFDEATEETKEIVEAPAEEAVETEEIQTETQAIDAPVSWDESGRAVWSELPPTAQEYLSQRESEREADYTQKTQEIADTKRKMDELNTVFEPYRRDLALQGMSEAQAVSQLLELQRFSAQDPVAYIKYAAQQLGVDLNSTVEDQEFVDPQQQQLQQQIQGLQTNFQTFQQQQIQSQQAQLDAQVTAFRDEKDAEGKSKHPHFDAVRSYMAGLVQAGQTMDQAYDNAIWTVPEVRQKMLDEANRQKVAKAKAAAGKAPKSTGVSSDVEAETSKDMRDTIGKLVDQASAA